MIHCPLNELIDPLFCKLERNRINFINIQKFLPSSTFSFFIVSIYNDSSIIFLFFSLSFFLSLSPCLSFSTVLSLNFCTYSKKYFLATYCNIKFHVRFPYCSDNKKYAKNQLVIS